MVCRSECWRKLAWSRSLAFVQSCQPSQILWAFGPKDPTYPSTMSFAFTWVLLQPSPWKIWLSIVHSRVPCLQQLCLKAHRRLVRQHHVRKRRRQHGGRAKRHLRCSRWHRHRCHRRSCRPQQRPCSVFRREHDFQQYSLVTGPIRTQGGHRCIENRAECSGHPAAHCGEEPSQPHQEGFPPQEAGETTYRRGPGRGHAHEGRCHSACSGCAASCSVRWLACELLAQPDARGRCSFFLSHALPKEHVWQLFKSSVSSPYKYRGISTHSIMNIRILHGEQNLFAVRATAEAFLGRCWVRAEFPQFLSMTGAANHAFVDTVLNSICPCCAVAYQ